MKVGKGGDKTERVIRRRGKRGEEGGTEGGWKERGVKGKEGEEGGREGGE